jgi:hypothetical protein
MTKTSDYSVFGLTVRSEMELPELFPSVDDRDPDVLIRVAALAEPQSQPGLKAIGEALLLTVPDVARFRIDSGREIVVELSSGAPERNVRLYLLGSAFGALLHQRGLLPLHANAVEIDGRAIAFMGESGAGKSTLAAWFHDRGFRVIADDVCVVGFDNGLPYAAPGLPRLRLWAEALELMGHSVDRFPRSYVGQEQQAKFDVPIDVAKAATSNIPLAALYLLDRGAEFAISELRGLEAADAVFANTYRGAFVSAAGNNEVHWRSSIGLVRTLPVFRVARTWDLVSLDCQSLQILEHARLLQNRSRAIDA